MDSKALFEEEISSLNPDHDLIFGSRQITRSELRPQLVEYEENDSLPVRLNIISTMDGLIGNKPLGELPATSQWDDSDNAERETVALMRRLGLEPSVDKPPNERHTISTFPTNDDVVHMVNGRRNMPIFMGDSYFKLKPRSPDATFDFDDSIETPRELVTTQSTTSESTDSPIEYRPFDSIDTTTSSDFCLQDATFPELEEPKSKKIANKKDQKQKKKFREETPTNWRNHSPPSESCLTKSKYSKKPANEEGSWRRKSTTPETNASGIKSWRSSTENAAENENKCNGPGKSTKEKTELRKPGENRCQVEPVAVSTCGRPLYRPKDLFLKKKALLVQKVFDEFQS